VGGGSATPSNDGTLEGPFKQMPAAMMGVTVAPTDEKFLSSAAVVDLLQFMNGIKGSGPMGFQAGIGAANPTDANYSPMWKISFMEWKDPSKASLILIDVVNDFLADGGKAYPLVKDALTKFGTIENLKRLANKARETDIRIFYSGMAYTDKEYSTWKYPSGIHKEMFEKRMFEAGSWGADWFSDLAPQKEDDDIICHTHKNIDVFATTDLDMQLRQHNIQDVIVAGMSSTLCVQSTVRSAMEKGYRVTAVKDASVSVGPPEVHDFVMKQEYPMISHAVISANEFADNIESRILATYA
jgi:nicotinamidase-related amidase